MSQKERNQQKKVFAFFRRKSALGKKVTAAVFAATLVVNLVPAPAVDDFSFLKAQVALAEGPGGDGGDGGDGGEGAGGSEGGDIPPVPAGPDGNLTPTEDGGYHEYDEEGNLIGEWRWDEEKQEWIFTPSDQEGNLPKTGQDGLPPRIILSLIICVIGTVAALWHSHKRMSRLRH